MSCDDFLVIEENIYTSNCYGLRQIRHYDDVIYICRCIYTSDRCSRTSSHNCLVIMTHAFGLMNSANLSLRLRQIIDLRDNRVQVTEFSFIIRSPSLLSYLNHSRHSSETICHFSRKSVVAITHEQNIICSKTHLEFSTHERTIICGQLFAGHLVGSRAMNRETKHGMIILIIKIMETLLSVTVGQSEIVRGTGAKFQILTDR